MLASGVPQILCHPSTNVSVFSQAIRHNDCTRTLLFFLRLSFDFCFPFLDESICYTVLVTREKQNMIFLRTTSSVCVCAAVECESFKLPFDEVCGFFNLGTGWDEFVRDVGPGTVGALRVTTIRKSDEDCTD